MSNRFSFVVLLVLIGAGLTGVLYFSIEPKTIPKIKLSQVDDPERFGTAVHERLLSELGQSHFVFFGISPDSQEDIGLLKGFLKVEKFDRVFMDPRLQGRSEFPQAEDLVLNQDTQILAPGFSVLQKSNQRSLIIGPNIFTSLYIHNSPASLLRKELNLPITSLSIGKPTWSREWEDQAKIPCITGNDENGTGGFGCLVLQKSRAFYRKQKTPGKFVGAMDQTGENDYLILFGQYQKN